MERLAIIIVSNGFQNAHLESRSRCSGISIIIPIRGVISHAPPWPVPRSGAGQYSKSSHDRDGVEVDARDVIDDVCE
jgi:hypothetical protein